MEDQQIEFYHVPIATYDALCNLQTTAYACCAVALDGSIQPPFEGEALLVLLRAIKDKTDKVYEITKQEKK